jgi:phage baseplate assembly protein gpV
MQSPDTATVLLRCKTMSLKVNMLRRPFVDTGRSYTLPHIGQNRFVSFDGGRLSGDVRVMVSLVQLTAAAPARPINFREPPLVI